MQSKGIIFVLSAPSGTGKTTVCRMIKQKLPGLKFSISHTSRKPRIDEKEGVDYYFIPKKDFEKKVKNGEFLEWAKVFKNYYGTAFEAIAQHQKKGEDVLIELDVQGAKSLRDLNYKAIFIFMLPPSLKELETRLIKRGTESDHIISNRLEASKKEMQQLNLYDYILTNNNSEETTKNLIYIIKAEHLRKEHYAPSSSDLKTLINNKGGD